MSLSQNLIKLRIEFLQKEKSKGTATAEMLTELEGLLRLERPLKTK